MVTWSHLLSEQICASLGPWFGFWRQLMWRTETQASKLLVLLAPNLGLALILENPQVVDCHVNPLSQTFIVVDVIHDQSAGKLVF